MEMNQMEDTNEIPMEEEGTEATTKGEQKVVTEEIKVRGEELVATVKRLIQEAGVRRIVVSNSRERILLELPLVAGLAGIVLLPTYSAMALVAALVADCTIRVERVEPAKQAE
jgi:hypothetical protein